CVCSWGGVRPPPFPRGRRQGAGPPPPPRRARGWGCTPRPCRELPLRGVRPSWPRLPAFSAARPPTAWQQGFDLIAPPPAPSSAGAASAGATFRAPRPTSCVLCTAGGGRARIPPTIQRRPHTPGTAFDMARNGRREDDEPPKAPITRQTLREAARLFRYLWPYRVKFGLALAALFLGALANLTFPSIAGNLVGAALVRPEA